MAQPGLYFGELRQHFAGLGLLGAFPPRGGRAVLPQPHQPFQGRDGVHHRHRAQGQEVLQLSPQPVKVPGLDLGDAPGAPDVRHKAPHRDLGLVPIAAKILLQRRVEGPFPQGADALPGPVPGEGRLAGGGKTRRVHQSSWNSRAKLS